MYRFNKFFRNRSKLFYGATILSAVVLTVALLEITNTTHLFHQTKAPAILPVRNDGGSSESINKSKGETATEPQKNSGTSQNSNPTISTQTSLPLVAPYGDFISNHAPGAEGSPRNVVSVCNTTPSATCYIKFTRSDGVISRLPEQSAGKDGSTSWSWDTNKLPTGSWYIAATASLNGQTKTTSDPTPLVIK